MVHASLAPAQWITPSNSEPVSFRFQVPRGTLPARLSSGAELGVGITTVYRYVTEAVEILATRAPDITTAARIARTMAFVILDGTLLPIDRIAADRPYYFGKHRQHGMNVQVLADPFGRLLWASPALPGAVHDIRAARAHGIIDALSRENVACWADKGYQGAHGTVRVPYRGRWDKLSAGQQAVNRSLAKIRAPGVRRDGPGRTRRRGAVVR